MHTWLLLLFILCTLIRHVLSLHTVPSGAPSDISVTAMDYTTMRVSWGDIPCTDRNGAIEWWIILVKSPAGVVTQLSTVSYMREVTVPALQPLSEYSATVTAVNDKGWGPASAPGYIITGQPWHSCCSLPTRPSHFYQIVSNLFFACAYVIYQLHIYLYYMPMALCYIT